MSAPWEEDEIAPSKAPQPWAESSETAPVKTSQSWAEEVVQAIDTAYERKDGGKPRSYIGGSMVGKDCDASVAFGLRGFPDNDFPPRVRRIFRDGHRIEEDVVFDLKKAGFQIWDRGTDGRQFAYHSHGGHVRSNIDGKVEGPDGEVYLLEIKSMNDASWKKFVKVGVASSHSHYADQCQFYMGASGMRNALFIAYNKNTSDYHAEIIAFDQFRYEGLLAKAERVLESGDGRRITNDGPNFFGCRFCSKRDACWEGLAPETVCRTCVHSKPTGEGAWFCNKLKEVRDDPCDHYKTWAPGDKI